MAFENEFSLARKVDDGPTSRSIAGLCFSTIATTASQDYAAALVAALDAQKLRLEQYYAELGHGQQELSTAHAPALQAADEQLLVRETIRGVASEQGLVASLAPKPWPENAGNGGHVHFSLWEGERNRFYAPDGLSELALAFVAGVLEHLPGLCGLTAPSFNSYHRIAPGTWSGAFALLGLRQPRGAGAGRVAVPRRRGGVDQRRAQGRRRDLQPVPRARRADRGGAGRDRARADAAGAGRRRPGARSTTARRAGSRRCPRARPRRSTRWPPTRS